MALNINLPENLTSEQKSKIVKIFFVFCCLLGFCLNSYLIFDDYIEGNRYVDMIPRIILYPFLKNMLYLEYLIQNLFSSNRQNNIFNIMKVKRYDYFIDKVGKLSLRKVLKFINPDPDPDADPKNKNRLNKKLLIKGI